MVYSSRLRAAVLERVERTYLHRLLMGSKPEESWAATAPAVTARSSVRVVAVFDRIM